MVNQAKSFFCRLQAGLAWGVKVIEGKGAVDECSQVSRVCAILRREESEGVYRDWFLIA